VPSICGPSHSDCNSCQYVRCANFPSALRKSAHDIKGAVVGEQVPVQIQVGYGSGMIDVRRILCPTDLTSDSDQALLYGLALARAYDARLLVCYCLGKAAAEAQDHEVASALARGRVRELFEGSLVRYLGAVDFADFGWDGMVVKADDIGEAICRTAAENAVSVIVMRSRRRPHRAAILGSTAESVCRLAPCPVLVTHTDEREWINQTTDRINLKRVLVPYDFSDFAELALRYALSLAQEHQAELHLMHVLPPHSGQAPEIAWYPPSGETAYHKTRRRLEQVIPPEARLWCSVKTVIGEGHPYREVLVYAEKNRIDLISLGAHGAGFGMRALFGSNVDRVLRQAPCPVLVARPLKPARVTGV
jgi:nucleotide-binding universal stress UspA family protein